MGYESFGRVPFINSYAEAVKRLENTKPIRGSDPLLYPLSERRYANKFSIRKVGDAASLPTRESYKAADYAKDGDIEVLLYGNPIITFHADNTLSIDGQHWHWSASDCRFLDEVLRYVRCAFTSKNRLVLEIFTRTEDGTRDTTKIVLPPYSAMRFAIDEKNAVMVPLNAKGEATVPTQTVWRIKRKEANNVRARYGQFFRYMKGMIGVRKEAESHTLYNYTTRRNEESVDYRVHFSADELVGALPTGVLVSDDVYTHRLRLVGHKEGQPSGFVSLTVKPPIATNEPVYDPINRKHVRRLTPEPYKRWHAAATDFIALISATDDDPQQTEKFYKAFVLVAAQHIGGNGSWGFLKKDTGLRVTPTYMQQTADEIVFKYHSEEVFELVPAREGTVPSVKYEDWVTRETDSGRL